ncbi:MAG TPA: ATP-binding protein [Kouleothrix sp.]|uniref:helicase HerA domain-containing protein n=1 Tax=Kouleothrix sp. TaxID=2779161 RepID=UPI002D16BFE6|nr:ATP-binding protein [Kouleothrix sp.]HRC77061.1 ATP-binding protein [Kouleothrix sp.]
MPPTLRNRLGVITSGSLVEGLCARLEGRESVEDMRVGKFVVIKGEKNEFFSMITDVVLEATNQKVLADPPNGDAFIHEVLAGTSTYGSITLKPMLMLPSDVNQGLLPPKTIPRHFAQVLEAEEDDFKRVFGLEDSTHFEIGRPLDMDVPVCLDLERLVERSNGVFGKSGTGKSFLTRLLICGTIKARVASNLIFDMHSEYGWESTSEQGGFVKGLRQLFGGEVLVYSLDPATSRNRNVPLDAEVVIGLDQIEVEDVTLLQDELNLTSTAAESAYLLVDRFKESWLRALLAMDAEALNEFAESSGGHAGALSALKRKLEQVARKGFVKESAPAGVIDRMIDQLEHGRHVVLEFGRYSDTLSYMLTANVLTRRIRRRWVEKTEQYIRSKNAADKPRQLMITIEEAHKFLNPAAAKQTIFGTIARELRKYSVTLLVVDQRPSSIDADVMSQIGSRVTALLNDEKDIDAVFTGVSGSASLKAVLASLDTRQQALVLGHAVPMPVVVRTRAYDAEFYRAVGRPEVTRQQAQDAIDELFSE